MSKQKNYCLPCESYPGGRFYKVIWDRIQHLWNDKLKHFGLSEDITPSSILVDVYSDEDGQPTSEPFTTFDETIHGDGKMADGIQLGTEESSRRAKANFRHVRLYRKYLKSVTDAKRMGMPVPAKPEFLSKPWNWTKGRHVGDRDEAVDIIGVVGEKLSTRPVDASRARAYVMFPNEHWAEDKKLKRKSKPKGQPF